MIASREFVIKTMVKILSNPKKKYSQNFLTDYEVVKKSVEALGDIDTVIEIGPGLGALTEELALKNKNVFAYEIDVTMVNHLKEYFSNKANVKIIKGDFLKQKLMFDETISFISNIPYSLTTPIIEKVILSSLKIDSFVFMLQKEAGARISAKKGNKDYGPLPIMLSYLGKLEVVCKVTRDKFLPSPNVDSVVMKLSFNQIRDYAFEQKLYSLLNTAFHMRRKTLANNLKGYFASKEDLLSMFKELTIAENIRPEELSVEEFVSIAKYLFFKEK